MKRILFTFLIYCSVLSTLSAQSVLTGKVVDEEKHDLPYVTVRLHQKDSTFVTGSVTDSLGIFEIKDIAQGDYILKLSFIGYTSLDLPIHIEKDQENISTITLPYENVQLGEFVVQAKSVIRTKDKLLILPDKKQVKHANTGYDLLSNLMIPGLEVDRRSGKVSTMGGDATLYIDGRKVDYREVRSLRPKDIQKVEYYDNPTGKYANDVVSINYITKKYKVGGYISLDGAQTIGYLKGDYNLVAKTDYKNTSYTLFGGHNMSEYSGIKNEKNETLLLPNNTVDRASETGAAKVKNSDQYVQLNIQNQHTKRTLLGKVSLVRNDMPNNYEAGAVNYAGEDKLSQQFKSQTDQYALKPAINLYGSFHLSENQLLETSVGGSYTNNEYSRNYTENTFSSHTNVEEEFYNLDVNMNYALQMKNQNSLTAQFYHMHKVSASTYTGDKDYWQHLWTAETLLFLEYMQRFGKKVSLRFSPGISSLQYGLHGEERVGSISPRLRSRLTYQPRTNQQLMLALNIGNSFPEISTINQVDQAIDMFQIKRGNPKLDKANLYLTQLLYSLQHKAFNIQASVYYLHVNHAIVNDYYIEKDKLIHSFRSDANYHNLASMLAVTWKVNDNLRVKADGTLKRTMLTGSVSESCNSLEGSLQLNYYWNDFSINLFGRSAKKSLDMSSIYRDEYSKYGAFVGWNRGNWGVEGGVDSPFTKHNKTTASVNTHVYNLSSTSSSRIFQQTGYVKVSYTFDFGRKTARTQSDVNTNINSAILKVE